MSPPGGETVDLRTPHMLTHEGEQWSCAFAERFLPVFHSDVGRPGLGPAGAGRCGAHLFFVCGLFPSFTSSYEAFKRVSE